MLITTFPMSVLYLTESQQGVVHLYFAMGGWKYWLQTWRFMRSALHTFLFVYVLSPRASFSWTGKDYIIDLGNPVLSKKYHKIWDKVSNSIKKGFHSKYNVPWVYLNTKTKSFRVKTNTHFHGNGMPKEGSPCISLSMTLIYFVFKTGKNFYPQVFLEECKYI